MIRVPHRQKVIEAIKDRLGGIFVSEGSNSNLGASVHEWRDPQTEPFTEQELPAAWIRDPSSETTAIEAEVHEQTISVELGAVIVCSSDENLGAEARSLAADLRAAIGQDPTFGGLCHYCEPQSEILEVRQGGKRRAGVRLVLQLAYRTPAWDEFNQHVRPT